MMPADSIVVMSADLPTLQALARALRRAGASVTPALGWADAESWLQRMPVALLVADIGEDPADLATVDRLRARFPRVGIIALASLPTPEMRAAEARGTVLAVLEKPITLARLEEAVGSALARRARG